MSRNDWIGASTSVGVHLALILIFLSLTANPDPLTAGFVEVEFGSFAEGRPVERALEQPDEEAAERVQDPAEVESQPEEIDRPETKPVDLPDQPDLEDEPEITSREAEEIDEQPASEPEDVVTESPDEGARSQRVTGQDEGTTGSETADEGPGLEEERAAPYVLEGIDRTPIRAQLPDYDEKVNAIIQVRITVDPRGRIVRVLPLRKGNPVLEQAVMQALNQWLFNPLAPEAPQENQTGSITFRFRLE